MDQEKIGKFIAKCRKERGLTQVDLAVKLGVTDKSISNWENGKNMPDISLFNLLCSELGISVNDLLSGEKVVEENYQRKLETNIINMIVDDKKKKRKKFKYLFIGLVFLLILLVLGWILYNKLELDVKYDARVMKCQFSNNELEYNIYGTSVLNTYFIERNMNGKKYLIFHSTISLYNKRHSNFEYGYSFAQLYAEKYIPFGYRLTLDSFKDDEIVYIYYSDKSIKNLNKLSNEKFLSKIEKFHKMCDNQK